FLTCWSECHPRPQTRPRHAAQSAGVPRLYPSRPLDTSPGSLAAWRPPVVLEQPEPPRLPHPLIGRRLAHRPPLSYPLAGTIAHGSSLPRARRYLRVVPRSMCPRPTAGSSGLGPLRFPPARPVDRLALLGCVVICREERPGLDRSSSEPHDRHR